MSTSFPHHKERFKYNAQLTSISNKLDDDTYGRCIVRNTLVVFIALRLGRSAFFTCFQRLQQAKHILIKSLTKENIGK